MIIRSSREESWEDGNENGLGASSEIWNTGSGAHLWKMNILGSSIGSGGSAKYE